MTLVFGPAMTRSLALLVLVALLFCHGFLGAMHQIPGPLGLTHHLVGEHLPHTPEDSDEHSGMPTGHLDYAVALFVVLFGAVLGLLLGDVRKWGRLVAPRLPRRFFPPPALYLARGSTVALLQVFRL